jgi:hypothetical protein
LAAGLREFPDDECTHMPPRARQSNILICRFEDVLDIPGWISDE